MNESVYLDVREWDKFDLDILDFVEKEMPKECKKFMRREGGRERTETRREARSTIKKKTGNFLKGVKVTRAWRNAKGGYGVKIRADHRIAPHTHLIEYGHRILTRKRRFTGYRATDFHIYENANEHFQGKFYNDTLVFVGQMLENGLTGK